MTKIDWDKPLETTDGEPVEIVRKIRQNGEERYLCLITDGDGDTNAPVIREDGYSAGGRYLVRNKRERIRGWVNVYANGYVSRLHASRDEAAKNRGVSNQCVACVEIDLEEGSGLE